MAFSWLPKATVQAALSGVIFTDAKAQKNSEMQHYGNIIQTVSIFSIVICAPIGAVLISTFGPIFLPHTPPSEASNKVVDIKASEKESSEENAPQKINKIMNGEINDNLADITPCLNNSGEFANGFFTKNGQ